MQTPEQVYANYVPWANSLDSAGTDSGPAAARIVNEGTLGLIHDNMQAIISLGRRSDAIKKWVYYGKDSEYTTGGFRGIRPEERTCAIAILTQHNDIRIYHALLGLFSEIGELFEMYFEYVFRGGTMDWENYTEEVGDLFWYMALLAKAINYPNFLPFLLSNRAKLVRRYGDAWSQDAAINRDHGAEMKSLQEAIIDGTAQVRGMGQLSEGTEKPICDVCEQPIELMYVQVGSEAQFRHRACHESVVKATQAVYDGIRSEELARAERRDPEPPIQTLVCICYHGVWNDQCPLHKSVGDLFTEDEDQQNRIG